MAIINQHDWSAVEEWFERRARAAGVSKYEHVETVVIPEPDLTLAAEFAARAAKLVDNLICEVG